MNCKRKARIAQFHQLVSGDLLKLQVSVADVAGST